MTGPVEPLRRAELVNMLNRPLAELRPIDLERVLAALREFHWDSGTGPSYDDQPSIGDLREGFAA